MTIYDIAKAANTSPSTVSRYFNNKKIKEETKKRIEQILKDSNYTPNAMARGLVSKKTKTIGIILIDIRLPHYAEAAYELECQLRDLGYNIIISNTHGNIEKTVDSIKNLKNYHVDALAFLGSIFTKLNETAEILNLLKDIPVLMVNSNLSLPNAYSLLVDDAYGIEICVDYEVKKGRKNLFLIIDSDTTSSKNKVLGFNRALKKFNLEYENHVIYTPIKGVQGGIYAYEEIKKRTLDCDVILCAEDILAVGIVNHLEKLGITPGKNIDVIGYNNSTYSEITVPSLTSVDTRPTHQATLMVEMLLKMLTNKLVTSLTFKPELVIKETA